MNRSNKGKEIGKERKNKKKDAREIKEEKKKGIEGKYRRMEEEER